MNLPPGEPSNLNMNRNNKDYLEDKFTEVENAISTLKDLMDTLALESKARRSLLLQNILLRKKLLKYEQS